jgi:hypothetical protein
MFDVGCWVLDVRSVFWVQRSKARIRIGEFSPRSEARGEGLLSRVARDFWNRSSSPRPSPPLHGREGDIGRQRGFETASAAPPYPDGTVKLRPVGNRGSRELPGRNGSPILKGPRPSTLDPDSYFVPAAGGNIIMRAMAASALSSASCSSRQALSCSGVRTSPSLLNLSSSCVRLSSSAA